MSFRSKIHDLVYAHGGEGETPEETIDVLERLVEKYLQDLTMVISETADYKGAFDEEAIKFALRHDPSKIKRVSLMFRSHSDAQRGSIFSLGNLGIGDTHQRD